MTVHPPTPPNDEAVEAAAKAIYDELTPECVDDDGAYVLAVAALAAAAPFVEARVRQQAADEIEAEGRAVVGMLSQETEKDRWRLVGAEDAYKHAIRLVRGDQEAGK